MNILDIAIAKQLAGGGGSGTDNYNELSNLPKINGTTLSGDKSSSSLGLQSEIKEGAELASDLVDDSESDNKFVTSAEKLEWSGKQDLIDNSHKLSSDLVNDADKTNKFVTASEKETWNGKQNLIDNSHKLSSDLVDDTNKTNKFVTSTEKNTWNAKQNAIDADHKLSSSLVSFSEAEAAALASGIDSTKVGQISTNQTNILYGINTGVKNLLSYDVDSLPQLTNNNSSWSWSGNKATKNGLTITFNADGTINAVSDGATTAETRMYLYSKENLPISLFKISGVNRYCIFGNLGSSNLGIRFSVSNSIETIAYDLDDTDAPTSFDITEANVDLPVTVWFYFPSGITINRVLKPMICLSSVYEQDSSFAPGALPNYDLTRLEAEDRAGLVECVDAGAKNLLDITGKANGSSGGIAYTFNSDGTITLNGTATGSPATYIYLYTSSNPWKAPNAGTYVMSCEGAAASDLYMYNDGAWSTYTTPEATLTKGQNVQIILRILNGKVLNNVTVKPMICTKAAFGVSNKFVPYRVPITGVYSVIRKVVACSTTETTTGIKFTSTESACYRISVTAMYSASKPMTLRVKQKTNSSDTFHYFLGADSVTNAALSVSGMMQLGIGGEFEVFAKYETAADNHFYVVVEKIG